MRFGPARRLLARVSSERDQSGRFADPDRLGRGTQRTVCAEITPGEKVAFTRLRAGPGATVTEIRAVADCHPGTHQVAEVGDDLAALQMCLRSGHDANARGGDAVDEGGRQPLQ